MNNCKLCNSENVHEAFDEGEDLYSCSMDLCPIAQIWFSFEEWKKLMECSNE
ncbi:MAG: hypothetical protein JKY67_08355 [Pseudomonadales bacterium]|nr:hypothetical protein [Pseudomonadales bacterium]